MRILWRVLALAGLAVIAWVCITAWPAVVHGHPAYLILLALTGVGCVALIWWSVRDRAPGPGWRRWLGIVAAVLLVGWLAVLAWLRPFTAVEPALTAMSSTATVVVRETPTQIIMEPGLDPIDVGVLFQPGARVDARAYAAVLRPLVDAGYTVVIAKAPLGIPFLSFRTFESVRDSYPAVSRWVVGGHSLGGTVAATIADTHDDDPQQPVDGLLLYASYPASDMSSSLTSDVMSISGTLDGLATPADIEDSRADLPEESAFIPIEGAVHASFGDYGPQPGDGTPTITQDEARTRIGQASLDFLNGLG
jgi:hypothetical protein